MVRGAPRSSRVSPPDRDAPDRRWVFVRHHDVASREVAVDPHTGALRRDVARGPDEPLGRGFFRDVDGRIYGVCASPRGPLFFTDRESTPLAEGAWAARYPPGPYPRRFELVAGGVLRACVDVPAPENPDPFDDDDTWNDFFAWLAAGADEPAFHRYLTV